jgi:hypothetical protein
MMLNRMSSNSSPWDMQGAAALARRLKTESIDFHGQVIGPIMAHVRTLGVLSFNSPSLLSAVA